MAGFNCFLRALTALLLLVAATVPVTSYSRVINTQCCVSRGTSVDLLQSSSTIMMTSGESASVSHSLLKDYLADAKGLGAVRFVVVGPGAILETVGSFDNLQYADTAKGRLATFSNADNNFECHLRVEEVKEVKMIVVEKFSKMLRISRFIGSDGATLLSAILQPEDKQGSIDSWEAMRTKYGDSIKFD